MRPYAAALPVGTVIDYDGTRCRKESPSPHESFPWRLVDGTVGYSNEWASRALANGGHIVVEES